MLILSLLMDFYKNYIYKAKDEGFLWVVSLLARESDVDGLYDNIQYAWRSIDSITDRHFLFVFAGNKYESQKKGKAIHFKDMPYSSKNMDVDYQRYARINWLREHDYKMREVAENHTSAINTLRDYFSIPEIDIPCLIFTSTHTEKHIIIPINSNDIYKFFKVLFNKIDEMLRTIPDLLEKICDYSNKKYKLVGDIAEITTNSAYTILIMQKDLFIDIEKSADKDYLFNCIEKKDYVIFDSLEDKRLKNKKLKGKVNNFIDLIKQYECRTSNIYDVKCDIEHALNNEFRMDEKKKQLENELSYIKRELSIVERVFIETIAKIESLISESKMSKGS